MKTLKYRSVLGIFATAALSVFLFTACEKESDGSGTPQKPDRLSKFKSLTYSGGTASTTTNSGSGTFIGNNNNVTFTSSAGGTNTNNETQFAPAAENDNGFTDPMSTQESSFVISNGFTFGSGTVSLGGKSYDIDLGFCASSDIFGITPGEGGNETEGLDVFIGVSGNFEVDGLGDTTEMPFNLLLFVFSYNGGSNIGSFDDFEMGDVDNGAFVVAAELNENYEEGLKMYFSTGGSVDFAGSNVTLSGISMAEVFETNTEFNLGSSVPLQGFLECGSLDFDEGDNHGPM